MRSHEPLEPAEAFRRLQQVVDSIPHAAVFAQVIHPDGTMRYEHASEGFERLFGVAPEELLADPTTLDALILPDDLPRARLLTKAATAGQGLIDCELRVRSRTGVVRWVRIRAATGPLPDGSTRVSGIMADESDRKQTEVQREQVDQARRSSEEALVAAQSIAKLGGFRYHVPTRTVVWTDEMHRILGRDLRQEPPSFDELVKGVHPEDRPRFVEALDRCARDGAPYALEYRAVRPDGSVLYISGRGTARQDETGQTVEIFGTVQDITERVVEEQARVKVEERLLQAQKLESLGLLAGGVAHDFNNLLTGVLTEASLALDDLPQNSPAQAPLRTIEASARRMSEMTKQLLTYAGGGPFAAERLDPTRLVSDMVDALRRSVARDVRLMVDMPRQRGLDGAPLSSRGAPCIEADPGQLRQVVMNLVQNASEAIQGRSGDVRIRAWMEESAPISSGSGRQTSRPGGAGSWVLEVADTGCGMDAETRRRVFDPFFTTKGRGRGLGLSTVQGIVRRLWGQVEVESEPDRGTTIRLRVPLVPGMASVPVPRDPPSRAPIQRLRILVVDDEEAVRITLSRVLGRRGHTVAMAADGEEAVEVFRNARGDFDLVLLDISMPRKNGYEALEALRGVRPTVRVVMMSGYSEAHLTSAGIKGSQETPYDGFLEKPFAVESIDRVLGEALRTRR
ncbi:hybrid sensor histidine kinase/response regulator [Chondromyces apiculatus]|nr:PAS domain-containing hybrid sensor histidine kinase/response regulator [Chondromyces apiculatus]